MCTCSDERLDLAMGGGWIWDDDDGCWRFVVAVDDDGWWVVGDDGGLVLQLEWEKEGQMVLVYEDDEEAAYWYEVTESDEGEVTFVDNDGEEWTIHPDECVLV